jgi:hydroxymethylglutaryl-CoA reductase (NADPH)
MTSTPRDPRPKDLRGDPPLPAIPRDAKDDLGPQAVEARRKLWEQAAGDPAPHVFGAAVPYEAARGKIENFVGFAQVPLGIAGPMRVDTSLGVREVYVPMATTEGAMVASYSRGMRLLKSGGGVRARVLGEGLTQNPILVYADAERAARAADIAAKSFEDLRRIVGGTTRHGRLVALRPEVVGKRLVVSLVFTTGDALGINMAAAAAELCSKELADRTGAEKRYLHGQDVEKRANARGLAEGRGRRVVADATVPRDELVRGTRATPEDLVAIQRTYAVGFAGLGTQNWLVQAANGLAAVMIACGQDAAYVTESATGMLDFEVTPKGDLYASVHLPCLLVGTVGGGTGQGTAAECLKLLGCSGEGKANAFAEILAATVLAGDLSLMAAFAAHEFVASHEKLGRNRPTGKA